jgi:cytoskeletal protein RodZ
VVEPVETTPDTDEDRAPRRSLLGGIGTIVSRVAKGRSHDLDAEHDEDPAAGPTEDESDEQPEQPVAPAARSAVPLRDTRPALRAQVTRDTPATVLGNVALHPDRYDADGRRRTPLPEGRELRRQGSVDLEFEAAPSASVFESGRVRPISTLGDPVDALVIDDFVTEPAYDPVIGPELAAARVRVGLSVDDLADRTRIRPHVIESIEVDDFAPCGGDFYARGHLRTLARVLGKDPAPLLQQFDDRYATAPINARRVFEAELATGMTGSMRSTVGGPNWALLVGVVLALVMTWGVVRLFAAEPAELLQNPTPVLNGSAGVGAAGTGRAVAPAPAAQPIRLTLVGAQAGSKGVVVRNGSGEVVWAGEIVLGEKRTVEAVPPVKVTARDAGALEARVNGKDRGSLGELGQPGRRTFHRPASR